MERPMMSVRRQATAVILVAALAFFVSPEEAEAQPTGPGGQLCDVQPCGGYVSGRTAMWVLVGVAAAGVTWWLVRRSTSDPEDESSPSVAAERGSVPWRPLPDWLQRSVDESLLQLSAPNGQRSRTMVHRREPAH